MQYDFRKEECTLCKSESMKEMWEWMRGQGISASNSGEWSKAYWQWKQDHPLPMETCLVIDHDTGDEDITFGICETHLLGLAIRLGAEKAK